MRQLLHDPLHVAIQERLKALRLAAGLSQRELAARMKCTDNVIVRLENGRRRLDLLEFYRLCHVLACDPAEEFANVLDAFRAAEEKSAALKRVKKKRARREPEPGGISSG